MTPDPSQAGPGFRIYRLKNDAADPLAGITFDPPKGSPGLRHALELSYPGSATHEARVRDAIIDFLISERNTEAVRNDNASSAERDSMVATVQKSEYGCEQGGNVTEPQLACNAKIATSEAIRSYLDADEGFNLHDDLERKSNHSASSAWKSMTSVWNPLNRKISKRGRKTPMTRAEKEEYRKIRKQGACSDCKKRKRKCSDDHYVARDADDVESAADRPRLRQKTESEPMASVEEVESAESLPSPDLGLNFADDTAFLNFVLAQNSELGQVDASFSTEYDPSWVWKPRVLSHKSSNLSEKRRSFLSYSSEPGMTIATSIDSASLHPIDAIEPMSISAQLAEPSDLAGLFIGDNVNTCSGTQNLNLLGFDPGIQDPSKRTPDMSWLNAWDQFLDASLDEARTSLEGLSMSNNDA